MASDKLEIIKKGLEEAVKKNGKKIEELGQCSGQLCDKLNEIQDIFDTIRNIPSETKIRYEQIKQKYIDWQVLVDRMERSFDVKENAEIRNLVTGIVFTPMMNLIFARGYATIFGYTGINLLRYFGIRSIASYMGSSFIFGSTGILSSSVLGLLNPLCVIFTVASAISLWNAKKDRERLEGIFELVGERDLKSCNLAFFELSERICEIRDEIPRLSEEIGVIRSFGCDYDKMSEAQQWTLGSCVNLMEAATKSLTNPIKEMLPKLSEEEYEQFCLENGGMSEYGRKYKKVLITLCNLFYEIELDDRDKKLLSKLFKEDDNFISDMQIAKEDFDDEMLWLSYSLLQSHLSLQKFQKDMQELQEELQAKFQKDMQELQEEFLS